MKLFLLFFLFVTNASVQRYYWQTCCSRQLSPKIERFLKVIGFRDLTLDQLRSLPIEQMKYS